MRKRSLLPFLLCLPLLAVPALSQDAEVKAFPKRPKMHKKVIVKVESVTLKTKADAKSKSVSPDVTVTQFSPVEIVAVEGTWAQIKTKAGKTGYVPLSALADSSFVSTSIKGEGKTVNLRSGPDMNHAVVWMMKSGNPVMVIDSQGDRILVEDWEGDGGWAHKSFLSLRPYVVASPPPASNGWVNLREAPGLDKKGQPIYKKLFHGQKGALFEVLEEKEGWLKLKYDDGDVGWCSDNIVWGWNEAESKAKKK